MKTQTDYAVHLAAALLAVFMGAGSVALAGGLFDGSLRDASSRATYAAPPANLPNTASSRSTIARCACASTKLASKLLRASV